MYLGIVAPARYLGILAPTTNYMYLGIVAPASCLFSHPLADQVLGDLVLLLALVSVALGRSLTLG